ncbi:MAG: hypothetical protein E7637_04030 [Ruminococcaceae bacterium]|nr:hypothetical protein [Oscillospiraceae bacterium]
MYSRYHTTPQKSVVLPKNYSGCAFSDAGEAKKASVSSNAPRVEVAKPTPEKTADAPQSSQQIKSEPPLAKEEEPKKEAHDAPVLQQAPVLRSPIDAKNGFPFGHGLGFEELLLLGLILLLSQTEENSDIALWLVLLLFCG